MPFNWVFNCPKKKQELLHFLKPRLISSLFLFNNLNKHLCGLFTLIFKSHVQQWNVVVVFCAVVVSCDWNQAVLCHKVFGGCSQAAFSCAIIHEWQVDFKLSVRLFEQNEDVTMQAGVFFGSRSDELSFRFTGSQVAAGDVHGQPVTNFSDFWDFGCVGV